MTCQKYYSIIVFRLSTHLMQKKEQILKHTINECKAVQILHFRRKAIRICKSLSLEKMKSYFIISVFATANTIFVNINHLLQIHMTSGLFVVNTSSFLSELNRCLGSSISRFLDVSNPLNPVIYLKSRGNVEV